MLQTGKFSTATHTDTGNRQCGNRQAQPRKGKDVARRQERELRSTENARPPPPPPPRKTTLRAGESPLELGQANNLESRWHSSNSAIPDCDRSIDRSSVEAEVDLAAIFKVSVAAAAAAHMIAIIHTLAAFDGVKGERG